MAGGVLATEMEELRANRQGLIDEDAAKALRVQRIEELREYIETQETALNKFDEDLFHRLIEKVSVKSLVEVTFVFKTGVEVKELLE
jgi:site-specific DNA recombinase